MTDEAKQKVLENLCAALFNAKKDEEEAKAKRVGIENQIADLIPTKERGSKTVHAVNFKVTVKRDLNYKVSDVNAALTECGADCFKQVPETWKLIPSAYEKLKKEDPKKFAKLARYVVVTAAKPSIELKL